MTIGHTIAPTICVHVLQGTPLGTCLIALSGALQCQAAGVFSGIYCFLSGALSHALHSVVKMMVVSMHCMHAAVDHVLCVRQYHRGTCSLGQPVYGLLVLCCSSRYSCYSCCMRMLRCAAYLWCAWSPGQLKGASLTMPAAMDIVAQMAATGC